MAWGMLLSKYKTFTNENYCNHHYRNQLHVYSI